jgi:hypothetical protein
VSPKKNLILGKDQKDELSTKQNIYKNVGVKREALP